MSAISQKSISGITSITSPAGTDDQISLHTSNTNEALKIDGAGNIHIHNHVNTTGISSASNFKTGSSNLHSSGLSAASIDVGSNIKLGNAGVITATSFVGDGSDLTNLPAGLGTALSATASSPLNKMYYTNQVLGVPSSVTVDVPASASKAYTQYADIKVESSADLIVAEGDDLIPDILGLADFGTFGGGASAGRIRVNSISNAANDGSPTVQKGLVITGVTTSTSFSGSGASLTNLNASAIASGTVPTARLGSGTASSSTFLAGDSTYKTVTGTTINNNSDNRLITGSGTANTLNAEATLHYSDSLSITGSATPLSGTGHNYSVNLYRDGGSGYGYLDVVTGSSNHTGVRIRAYHNGTYNNVFEHTTGDFTRFYTGGNERLRITPGGNIGVAGDTGTDFSLLDGMVINTANGSAGLIINSSSSSHNAYMSFGYGSGSSTSHADQFSAYVGRVGDNNLIFGTNNTIRAQFDSSGNFNIGANASSNPFNYLRFGASQYGAADIRPKNEANHKVGLEFYTDGTQDTTINPTVKMTIDSAGTVTTPLHPVFATRINYVNTYYSTDTKIAMKAAHIDTRSSFSDANDRYVAPAAGRYLFYFFSNIDYNGDGTIACIFKKNGSSFTASEGGHIYSYAQNSGWHLLGGQIITTMSVNDYIEVWTTANNMKVDGNHYGQFGGYMIG